MLGCRTSWSVTADVFGPLKARAVYGERRWIAKVVGRSVGSSGGLGEELGRAVDSPVCIR
jgi:hypothetical protein